jgi:hypothetical protein
MGSEGDTPRRPRRSRHLPKVGTATENDRALHEEREAVLDNIGLAGAGSWTKFVIAAVAVLILVVAVVTLVALD